MKFTNSVADRQFGVLGEGLVPIILSNKFACIESSLSNTFNKDSCT